VCGQKEIATDRYHSNFVPIIVWLRPRSGSAKKVETQPQTKGQIQVQGPMTVSDNIINNNMTLKLRMYKGRYYEDWNLGAIQGTIWEGQFVAEVTDENGKIINQTDLSKFYKGQPLTFTSMFKLKFSDYNNDGDMDFALGQYGSSNGNFYKIFTVRKNGKVEELNVKDYPSLVMSGPANSMKLEKVDNLTFKKNFYDNSKLKYFEDFFKWDGQQFIRIKQNESETPFVN